MAMLESYSEGVASPLVVQGIKRVNITVSLSYTKFGTLDIDEEGTFLRGRHDDGSRPQRIDVTPLLRQLH